MSVDASNAFISRWSKASPSERANSQLFLSELCDLLAVPHPDPSRDTGYGFEYEVTQHHPDGSSSKGRIDLYKRACFVLESKQFQAAKAKASQLELAAREVGLESRESSQPVRGSDAWDDAIIKARGQADDGMISRRSRSESVETLPRYPIGIAEARNSWTMERNRCRRQH